MKIRCTQQNLSRGLSVVSHAVSNRSTLPILANVLLATENGQLKLSATNLEIGINYLVEVEEIIEEGATTVPARLIADFVGSLPQGTVEISTPEDSNTMTIESGDSHADIKGMDSSEFPLLPSGNGDETPVTISAALLKEMISEVVFAAAEDDSRPVFTGVLTQFRDNTITFAAADAFRLAVRTAPLDGLEGQHDDILIPARTLNELARILPAEDDVQLIVTPNRSQVLFHTQQLDLVSRLIEGNFPNFQQIIPKEATTRAEIATKEFAARIKLAALFARDSSNITRIKINQGDIENNDTGSLTIEATAEDLGNNTSKLNAKVDGPEQQIIFNVKYLSDVMAVIGTDNVAIEVTAPTKPGVIKPANSIKGSYTYVIMPMHTNR